MKVLEWRAYPVSEVVSKCQVPSKGVCKGVVKLKHFQKSASLDGVKVTVRQRSHVRSWLTNRVLFPEIVTKDVTLTLKETTQQMYKNGIE